MAVNPAVRFPTYYGNTQAGGTVYVPGNPNPSTPGGNTQTGGQIYVPGHEGHGVNLFNMFGSNFNGWLDPLNIAQNYAITPLKPPAAPGFSPGTMPTQNFTNNDFGDLNPPSMQATAGGAHPGILVQPPAPAPPPPPPAAGNGGGPPAGGIGLQAQQSNAAHNVVSNSHITGLNPSTLSNDYLFAKGGTPHDLLLSGGTPAPHSGFMASLKSKYGQTPNTAISKSAISVPASYNSTTSHVPSAGSPPSKFSGRLSLTGGGR